MSITTRKVLIVLGIGCGAIVVAIAAFLIYMGATDRDVNPAEIPGHYSGRYVGGVETFLLNPDGTFSQTFRSADRVVYSSSGTWAWSSDEGKIFFEPLVSPDFLNRNDGKPIMYGRTGIPVDGRRMALIIKEDYAAFAAKSTSAQ